MVVISFSKEFETKVRKCLKCQTIRYNAEYWTNHNIKDHPLDVWCPSPRGGNGVKLGIIYHWRIELLPGKHFTYSIAEKDGFKNIPELKLWLMKNHKMSYDEVNKHIWIVIRWEMIDFVEGDEQ